MQPIYLDHAATTPMRPEVREAMAPYLEEMFGNPSSSHAWGRSARHALEEARERLAGVLGAERREVVFTGGGTEADNLAVLGRWRAARRSGAPGAVVCSAVEHKAVLDAVEAAAEEGARAIVLGVDEDGRVLTGALDDALATRPAVVSVMWGNNEIGVLQPVAELAARCREAGIHFHSDAVQAFGRVPVRVDEAACDLVSVSAHKVGGPKGVGALYVRSGVELVPLVHGGGQEGGVRPGTVNVAGAVGLSVAAELAVAGLDREAGRLRSLRDRLEAALVDRIPGAEANAAGAERLPQVLSLWVPGVPGEPLLMALDVEGIAASGGSACQSGAVEPSHVLTAIGRTTGGEAEGAAVRLSLGWTTTDEDVSRAITVVPRVVERVREFASI